LPVCVAIIADDLVLWSPAVERGDRVAQLILERIYTPEIEEVEV
jgi:dUTPase